MSAYFAKHAKELQALGYDPVPVGIGKKAIYDTGWQHNDYTDTINDPPLRIGRRGISHRTVTAPAIDIDVLDEGIANQLAVWLDDKGFKSFRYGEKPKFACIGQWPSAPRKKQTSNAYDMKGKECKIEILGDGQQIVMLNRHPNGHDYTWTNHILPVADCPVLTEALVDELFDFFEQAVGDRYLKVGDRRGGDERDTTPNVVDFLPEHTILEHLSRRDPNEGYDDWVTTGMMVYHAGGTFDTWYDWSCNATAYPDPDREELLKKWNSFDTDGRKATFPLDEDMAFDAITSALPLYVERMLTERTARVKEKASKWFRTGEQMLAHRIDPDWLIKGILEKDTVSLLFGEFTTFKSFIALDLSLHVATGMSWRNAKTHQGPVFFLAGEGHGGLARRVQAWHQYHNVNPSGFYASTVAANLMVHEAMEEMTLAIEELEQAPALVVIDTLASSSGGGDENSATDVSRMLTEINSMRHRWKCAVLIVHHTGQKEKDRARGSYALPAGVDCMYRADRTPESMAVKLTNTKMKDGSPPEPMVFEAVEIELGKDADGAPVTSLIMAHDSLSPGEAYAIGLKMKGATATALVTLFDAGGKLKVEEWSSIVREKLGNSDPYKAFNVAKKRLLEKALIDITPDDFVVCSGVPITPALPEAEKGNTGDEE